MKHIITFAIALLATLPLYAQNDEQGFVQVTGYASREVSPDEFTLSIEISEGDSKGRHALQEQEQAIVDALEAAKIDVDNNLRLVDNSSDYFRHGISLAQRRYELTLHSNDQLVAAFDALHPLGLSSVTLTKASCSTLEQIRDELRREAICNARNKAQNLAEAIEQSIGACIMIVDYNNDSNTNFSGLAFKRKSNVEYAAVTVESPKQFTPEFRSVRIEHQLSAKFELLPE